MAQGTYRTPNQLVTEIQNRTGTNRSGVTARWTPTDMMDALSQAIAMADPYGRKRTILMNYAGYTASPQTILTPAFTYFPEIIAVQSIYTQKPTSGASQVPQNRYEIDRFSTTQWLQLMAPIDTTDVLRITLVEFVDPSVTVAAPTLPVYLDSEMLISYAMHVLYQSYVDYAQTSSREDDQMRADEWRQRGDMRRQQMIQLQYPMVQLPAAAAAPSSHAPSHH